MRSFASLFLACILLSIAGCGSGTALWGDDEAAGLADGTHAGADGEAHASEDADATARAQTQTHAQTRTRAQT